MAPARQPTAVREEILLYASHHQFFLQDSERPLDPNYSEEAAANRSAIGNGVIAILTGSYDHVRVIVEQHFGEPQLDLTQWDHVTQAGLDINSGMVLIYGCISSSGLFFRVAPGHYCVRSCHANLAAATDSTGDAGDWYLIQFWPAAPFDLQVLKRWQE
jgi:hypothetical protein